VVGNEDSVRVEPNQSIGAKPVTVLIEEGVLHLPGGETSVGMGPDELPRLREWFKTLDPNLQFVLALVPKHQDENVFFRFRLLAREYGLHAQAPREHPEILRQHWQASVTAVTARRKEE